MRSPERFYSLTFLLPAGLTAVPGLRPATPEGCVLDVPRTGPIEITGPSRESVFEHASRFLQAACRHRPPQSISAILVTPASARPSGRDSWSIIIGARVAFSPTSLDPFISRQAAQ